MAQPEALQGLADKSGTLRVPAHWRGRPVGEVTSAVACYFSVIVRYENAAVVRLTNHIVQGMTSGVG